MPFLLDIIIIVSLSAFVFFGQLVLLVPKRAMQAVGANCFRSNGSWSAGRTRIEFLEFIDVSGNLFIGFLLILAITIGPLLLVHNYVIPISMATDVFSAFHLDPIEWEAGIESEALGDVGAQYEAWGAKLGFSSVRLRFWQEFLWAYWPVFIGLIVTVTAVFYFFITRFYSKALLSYTFEVFERRTYYAQGARHKRSRRRSPRTPA